MELEHATDAELVEELMRRTNFVGVLVHVEQQVTSAKPPDGRTITIRRSSKISVREAAWMLAKGTEVLVGKLAPPA